MSQSTLEVPNQARSTYRAAVNDALQALASCFSGANAPSETYAYMFWADTTSGILKQRNAADDDWVEILDLATGAPVQLPVAAGQSEMEAGTEDGLRLMSPLRVAQAIAELSPAPEIASAAEAETGTDNTKFVTPLRVRDAFNASGSAPIYACRAWVNFDGTTNSGGNCDVNASGNVSSVTDNGMGDYTINFTTAMPDVDYACVFGLRNIDVIFANTVEIKKSTSPTVSAVTIIVASTRSASTVIPRDADLICVSVFR